jgi:hypothetical protein
MSLCKAQKFAEEKIGQSDTQKNMVNPSNLRDRDLHGARARERIGRP